MKTLFLLLTFLMAAPTWAAIQKQDVDYKSADGTALRGFVAVDDTGSAKKPAVIVVPDWMGLGDFPKAKAEELAKMGYVAFAVDMYGKLPKDAKEAGAMAGALKGGDRKALRQRIEAAYEQVKKMKNVDPAKIVVMGYCFGGTVALELARSGAKLAGAATFHGGLSATNPGDAKKIKEPLLIMHGGDDPHVPPAEVAAFKKEMKDANVTFTFITYPGAVHAFAIPTAGNDVKSGAAYNAAADKGSWQAFTGFLKHVTGV